MKKRIISVGIFFIFCFSLFATAEVIIENDGSVMLPSQQLYNSLQTIPQQIIDNTVWREFFTRSGNWTAVFDNISGMPRKAFGKPVKISGFDKINKNNAEAAARAFIEENKSIFRIASENLKLRHATQVKGKWYVSFAQLYNGIEVLLTEIELRISKNGYVFALGADYYPELKVATEPTISQQTALAAAHEGLEFNPKTDKVLSAFDRYILPVKYTDNVDFKLVYKISVETSAPGLFDSYVDACSGELVWRINNMNDAESKVNIKGYIKRKNPQDQEELVDFPGLYVKALNRVMVTDKEGNAAFELDSSININLNLEGPFVKVSRDTATKNAKGTVSVKINQNSDFIWNNTNSHLFERSLFHHANFIRDYHKALDPELTCMDLQIAITISYATQNTNALSSGQQIYYIGAGNPYVRFVESASVLYHEWGHSLNKLLYQQLGANNGMINASCNEAHADITAAFINDDPEIGKGTFINEPSQPNIRNCKNKMTYPDSVVFESHNDGKILAGAFWDLRELIGMEKAQELSHYTKYAIPDDPNLGVAFLEWFIETLVTDDDDDNLSNGTPNYLDIFTAFNNHKIGTGLYLKSTFKHEPYQDTRDSLNPYIIEFELSGLEMPGCHPENVMVNYSTDNKNNFNKIECTEYEPGKYRAAIPAQKYGKIVYYFISATDAPSQDAYRFDSGLGKQEKFYSFLVGFDLFLYDDFNNQATASQWTLTQSGDAATQGNWEWNIPNRIYVGQFPFPQVQPAGGFKGDQDKCFVTGSKGTNSQYRPYMPNGKVTLISPPFKLSEVNYPVIRYKYWFFNLPRISGEHYKSRMVVNASSNNGKNWLHIYTTKDQTNGWENYHFPVAEYLTLTDSVRLRFIVDPPQGSGSNLLCYVEGLVDELIILQSAGSSDITSVNLPKELLNSFSAAPNPFSDNVSFMLDLKTAAHVSVSAINLLGEEIANIAETQCSTGQNIIQWNGTDNSGKRLPAGMYFVKYTINGAVSLEKVLLK